MLNRRDLLKYFGIGTTIVPLVNGAPEFQAPAKLIETPKLDPQYGRKRGTVISLFIWDGEEEKWYAATTSSRPGSNAIGVCASFDFRNKGISFHYVGDCPSYYRYNTAYLAAIKR